MSKTILLSEVQIVDNPEQIEDLFDNAAKHGLEGVMAKKLSGSYQAGARSWNWIKYKKSYSAKIDDTIDAVVMGYDFGQGKRQNFGIGDFLIGIYDSRNDKFVTVSKVGTGLTDLEWRELKVNSEKLKVKTKPARYEVDSAMNCDVWIEPKLMVEITADEITRSAVHTAGRILKPSKNGKALNVKTSGFALRFPRLKKFRDKKPEDATSLKEIEEMYKRQKTNNK